MKAPATTHDDLLASDPTRYSHTAPSAPNGVRDLLVGLLAALVLSGLLPSCAAPARLPMPSVVHHAGHDPRTKLVEPTPLKPR